jgi:N-methylhydantoinase A
VTDANLLLGRLQADAFLGGAMTLDPEAARQAMGPLAAAMGCTLEDAALGVVRVANEHMTRALRVISVQRGIDPRGFTLASFGGAGGLHVCALAEALGMRQAMVPVHAGVLSALGMLATRPGRQLSRTWLGPLEQRSDAEVEQRLSELEQGGRRSLQDEGMAAQEIEPEYSLDLRYLGQSYTLNVPWTDIAGCTRAFGDRHEARYGHRMDLPVELVNLRVALRAGESRLDLVEISTGPPAQPVARVAVHGVSKPVPRLERSLLTQGQSFPGPALITETVATTWLAPGWRCRVDRVGNLLLDREL